MITIKALPDRIRRDSKFGHGEFVVGCYDRGQQRVVAVSLADLTLDPAGYFAFYVLDENRELQYVPFHRVRQVFNNGELIRHRKDAPAGAEDERPAPGEPRG